MTIRERIARKMERLKAADADTSRMSRPRQLIERIHDLERQVRILKGKVTASNKRREAAIERELVLRQTIRQLETQVEVLRRVR